MNLVPIGRGSGPPLIVYHDVIDDETDGNIEICVPVDRSVSGDSGVYARELESATVPTTVHRGPYEEIAPLGAAMVEGLREVSL